MHVKHPLASWPKLLRGHSPLRSPVFIGVVSLLVPGGAILTLCFRIKARQPMVLISASPELAGSAKGVHFPTIGHVSTSIREWLVGLPIIYLGLGEFRLSRGSHGITKLSL